MAKKQQTEQKPREILKLEEYYGIILNSDQRGTKSSSYYQDSYGPIEGIVLTGPLIEDIAPIGILSDLKSISLDFTQVKDLRPLEKCRQLTSISISSERFDSFVWPTELQISHIGIFGEDIIPPPEFSLLPLLAFPTVNQLELFGCNIKDLHLLRDINLLKTLFIVDSEYNNDTHLQLPPKLNELTIHNCPKINLDKLFTEQNQLTILQLTECAIWDLSSIGLLTKLKYLDVGNNLISDLTPLTGLKKLKTLTFHNNYVQSLQPIIGLNELEQIFAENNSVEVLPLTLIENMHVFLEHRKKTRKQLVVGNNPLIEPPIEIVEQGQQAILNWFVEQKKGIRPLNEVRIMLIGHGSAGKTSLMHRLTHDGYSDNEETTHGINLETWMVKDAERTVKVNLWDFGGQQMQHSVHKFFLSNACLYVLVADNRKEDDPQYWLEHIRTLAKNAPVLVVYNKMDQNPDEILGRKTLQDRYPNIIGFHNVSCRTGYGLQDLRSTLESLVLNSESASKQYPLSWFNVKQQLEAATGDGRHHISYHAYEVICEEQGITDPAAQRSLLGVLSAIGTISFFDDADLDRLQILNPEWVTEGVYRIVTDERVGKRRGDITSKDLPSLLKPKVEGDFEYKQEHYPFLLALMKKFEVCQVRDDGHILIPARFSLEPKANYADYRGQDARLYFLFYKSFLPLSIIHRFITRHLNDAINEDYWYRGIVIKDPTTNTEAFVELNENERRVYLWFKGDDIIGYWGYLRRELRELSNFFSGIEYDEYVAIDEGNRGKLWVKYSNLRRSLNRGLSTYYDPSLDMDIDVIKYLNIFDGENILRDFRKGLRKGQIQSAIDSLNVNISPQFHLSQSQIQHQETSVNVKVQQLSDDIMGKLSVLMQENENVVAQNRLRQVKEATEALELEADPRNAKRSGMLDRYAHFLTQLKQGGEWVNTITDASKNLPQLTQRMASLLEHFQGALG